MTFDDEEIELLDPYDTPTSRRSRVGKAPPSFFKKHRRDALLIVGALGSLGAAVVLNIETGERLAPLDVRGVWVTSAPLYAGRAMEIKAGEVVFFTGDSSETSRLPILLTRRRSDADGLKVQITYGDPTDPQLLSVLYRSSQDLRLVNQPDLAWRRESAYPTPVLAADSAAATTATGRMSPLPPELAYCITEVTKDRKTAGPVSCKSWLLNNKPDSVVRPASTREP